MTAIDTNVLVRLVVKDDEIQARKALRFVRKQGEVFISIIVVCETAWVLESCYDFKKSELISVFENMLSVDQFYIESPEAVWLALSEYKKINTDFSDCIIGAVAKINGRQPVATFDKKSGKSLLFELIR